MDFTYVNPSHDLSAIVWLYCICHKSGLFYGNNFQREPIGRVYDGGECFFNLKINLTKQIYFDLSINGDA
jgi:hypothetical protein